MAQGNIIQGQAKGKLGDMVLMVRKGKQVERVYTTSGARSGDAASEAARYQRVRFGAAANQWAIYRYVCTRMYRKGIKTKQSDYNYFVKRNINFLPFLTKNENANGIHVIMPGQFSEGNLGIINLIPIYGAGVQAGSKSLKLLETNNNSNNSVKWTDTMSALKTALRGAYQFATKYTYLFMFTSTIDITESDFVSQSQLISYETVIIDLFNEETQGENNMTVIEYFTSKIKNSSLKTIFGKQTDTIVGTAGRLFYLESTEEEEIKVINSLGVLTFATNDNVSDVYSTIQEPNNTPDAGPYETWYGYRTMEALTSAAQSYGYQTGVMRDNIASVDDLAEETLLHYIENVEKVDKEAAQELRDEIAKSQDAPIKSSRKKTENNTDENN